MNGPSLTTKMAVMPICGKTLKPIFFSGTDGLISMNVDVFNREFKVYCTLNIDQHFLSQLSVIKDTISDQRSKDQ